MSGVSGLQYLPLLLPPLSLFAPLQLPHAAPLRLGEPVAVSDAQQHLLLA